jgi:ubiquinone/menaquinone biosynthesis C-methylase UbiE
MVIKKSIKQEYFNFYLKEGMSFHHQAALYKDFGHLFIMKTVKTYLSSLCLENAICLDIGCAEGYYTSWMVKKSEFAIGIDISLPKLKRTAKNPKTSFILADWDYLPFRNSIFNICLFIEGPEHCLNPYQTLKEINRVMASNAFLIISAPIADVDRFYENALKRDGHFREFTPASFKSLLEKTGFKIVKTNLQLSTNRLRRIIELISRKDIFFFIHHVIKRKLAFFVYKSMKPNVIITVAKKVDK